MHAFVLTLAAPVIPLLAWKSYHKDRKAGEYLLRYGVYLLLLMVISSVVMLFLGSDGVSIQDKMDMSPGFALKYTLLQILLAALTAGLEWLYVSKKLIIEVDWKQYQEAKLIGFCRKYVLPNLIYVLAAVMIVLNVILMFDNVVWGDEAFSANTARKTMGGILQVSYYWDCHPPLYYYWLKLLGEVLGHTGTVYHLASVLPFAGGIIMAVTVMRKHFGKVPAAFFIVITGLGKACLEYNQEIRMYALAFFCVAACFYCAYRVLDTGKRSAWIGMVLWGLAGAYTHYYALASAGLILFFTGAAFWIQHRGRTWLKGLAAVLIYIAGYIPWLYFVFAAMENFSGSWWMTEILGLSQCLDMIMGSQGMKSIILPLLLAVLVIVLAAESSIFEWSRKEEKALLQIHTPSVREWSSVSYILLVGLATIVGTLIFGYVISVLLYPLLAARYLYPLSAVAFMMVVMGSGRVLELIRSAKTSWRKYLHMAVTGLLLLLLLVLLRNGLRIYKEASSVMKEQKAATEVVLATIGTPDEDVKMVANGVQHLSWTVLYYYYPENEIIGGHFRQANADKYWYFTANYLNEAEVKELQDAGYLIYAYGEAQISRYPFVLYYMEKAPAVQN